MGSSFYVPISSEMLSEGDFLERLMVAATRNIVLSMQMGPKLGPPTPPVFGPALAPHYCQCPYCEIEVE